MHIPEKYRDRYDRLALSHPWMREMRDEDARDDRNSYEERLYDVKVSDCPYCGCSRVVIHEYNDAYERPNSYRVEHVDEKEAFNCDCFESYYGFDSIEKAVEHADMRDEPTNGIDGETNVNPYGSPLVEGDAVKLLRKYIEEYESANGRAGTRGKRLLQIADMVERDYVSRQDFEAQHRTLCAVREQRDRESEANRSYARVIAKLEAERDEALEIRDKALSDAATFKYERDELADKIGEITDEASELMKKQPHTFAVHDAPGSLRTVGRYIDELTAERDEWRAKAEQAQESYLDAKSDRDAWHARYVTLQEGQSKVIAGESKSAKRAAAVERLKANKPHTYMSLVCNAVKDYEGVCDTDAFIDLLTDNDGATNLEWLFEHDYETLCDQMGGQPCSCCVVGCEEDLGSDEACAKALREWLMAPHSDLLSDSESSQRACESIQREPESVHSKAQSKTGPKLTEQSESLSDEGGEMSDEIQKSLNSDSCEKLCTLDVYKDGKLHSSTDIPKPSWEPDSREKLEADLKTHLYEFGGYCFSSREGHTDNVDTFFDDFVFLLDRQAAITANETSHDNPYVGLVRGKQWERTEISDYYCGRCGWRVTDHDSYCPECGGALHKAPSKPDSKFDARKTAETPETDTAKGDIRDFDDSREKLEEDVRAAYYCLSDHELDPVFAWLDRQDAITRRELQDEVDRLKRENAALADDLGESETLRAGR